jgi:hypothetical protein
MQLLDSFFLNQKRHSLRLSLPELLTGYNTSKSLSAVDAKYAYGNFDGIRSLFPVAVKAHGGTSFHKPKYFPP